MTFILALLTKISFIRLLQNIQYTKLITFEYLILNGDHNHKSISDLINANECLKDVTLKQLDVSNYSNTCVANKNNLIYN